MICPCCGRDDFEDDYDGGYGEPFIGPLDPPKVTRTMRTDPDGSKWQVLTFDFGGFASRYPDYLGVWVKG